MRRSQRGSASAEFALAVPILALLIVPSVQLARAALLQLRVESLALDVARRLAASPAGADLDALGRDAVARVRPALACETNARLLWTAPAAPPRARRDLEVIDVDLRGAGPRLWPGAPELPVRGHGRVARWRPS